MFGYVKKDEVQSIVRGFEDKIKNLEKELKKYQRQNLPTIQGSIESTAESVVHRYKSAENMPGKNPIPDYRKEHLMTLGKQLDKDEIRVKETVYQYMWIKDVKEKGGMIAEYYRMKNVPESIADYIANVTMAALLLKRPTIVELTEGDVKIGGKKVNVKGAEKEVILTIPHISDADIAMALKAVEGE